MRLLRNTVYHFIFHYRKRHAWNGRYCSDLCRTVDGSSKPIYRNMKYLFLDCESAGLRGEVFAAALINENGKTIFDGYFQHADLVFNDWLRENVAPNVTGTCYENAAMFRAAFADAYESCRTEYGNGEYNSLAVVAHCGAPVEANFFQQLFDAGEIGEFSGPFPLLDTAPLLAVNGYDPTSEQAFADSAEIVLPENYKPHSALADAQLTRLVWQKLTSK